MKTLYHVRAVESDSGIERFSISTVTRHDALRLAKHWASAYYGEDGATWFQATGDGAYIAGRLYKDGYREPGTCTITVEEVEA